MNKKRLNILIIILVLAILFGVYFWYSSKKGEEERAVVAVGISENNNENNTVPPQSSEGVEILNLLSLLKTVTLDLDFFKSPNFKRLIDFSVELPVVQKGRDNPFAPLE